MQKIAILHTLYQAITGRVSSVSRICTFHGQCLHMAYQKMDQNINVKCFLGSIKQPTERCHPRENFPLKIVNEEKIQLAAFEIGFNVTKCNKSIFHSILYRISSKYCKFALFRNQKGKYFHVGSSSKRGKQKKGQLNDIVIQVSQPLIANMQTCILHLIVFLQMD